MPAIYADASALVKLVAVEPQTAALKGFVAGVELLSSELILTEVRRALRRIDSETPHAKLDLMLARADELLETVTMAPVERLLLGEAGMMAEPWLRTLDAIHVITACCMEPVDAFVTYDVRQAAAARLAGLRTVAPGF